MQVNHGRPAFYHSLADMTMMPTVAAMAKAGMPSARASHAPMHADERTEHGTSQLNALATPQPWPAQDRWAELRPIITRLYREENKTLKDTMEIMEREHNFSATYENSPSPIPLHIIMSFLVNLLTFPRCLGRGCTRLALRTGVWIKNSRQRRFLSCSKRKKSARVTTRRLSLLSAATRSTSVA